MIYFLQEVAKHVYENHREELSRLNIVFPGKRARLYFNRYLTGLTDKPVWAPQYYSISELMQQLSGLMPGDPLNLVFDLYTVYKEITKSEETFDNFYFYAEILLADFDDIDKYLIDAKDLFQNLASLKNIDNYFNYLSEKQIEAIRHFWNTFETAKLPTDQQGFLDLWQVLYKIYQQYNSLLEGKGLSYEGRAYRNVADMIATNDDSRISTDKYIFIGFNALNTCEKKLFRFLNRRNQASFYWDTDGYYMNNQIHEAGYFLRDNVKEFPSPAGFDCKSNLTDEQKNIQFISVPSNVGQAKILSDCLKDFPEESDFSKTAIVLADENLLVPVLHSLPDNIPDFNVSMGYPFRQTPAFSLIELLLDLQRGSMNKNGQLVFYYKHVLALLNHQYFIRLDREELNQLTKKITDENMFYVSQKELNQKNFLKSIFKKPANVTSLPDYLLEVLHDLSESAGGRTTEDETQWLLEKEFIFQVMLYLNRLKEILENTHLEFSENTFRRLLRKLLQQASVPFSGEPLTGMQVMGILETRTLDFENLVILSMNEGIYPKSGNVPSFIPYNLRFGFGLPTLEHQDAIFAYYFYRLIGRAQNITLVYNSKADGLFTGERSRFLHQLFYESVFKVKEKEFALDVKPVKSRPIQIKKNDTVLKLLQKFQSTDGSYLSPSAINTFIDCSLKFYFRYIAGLKEPEEVKEEIDPAVFGRLLHMGMNYIYKPFEGKMISSADFDTILKQEDIISVAVDEAFRDEYFKSEAKEKPLVFTGKNRIVREIISRYINQILQVDKNQAPFEIVSLEKRFGISMPVIINGIEIYVRVGGVIDRVDRKDGMIRILDYKTGKDSLVFKDIDSLFMPSFKNRNKAVFQTILYGLIYQENDKAINVKPALYLIREIFSPGFTWDILEKNNGKNSIPLDSVGPYRDDFYAHLKEVLTGLFHPESDFDQTDDLDICNQCPYAKICHR